MRERLLPFSCALSLLPVAPASPAYPPAIAVDVSVFLRKLVAVVAMRLPRMNRCRRRAAQSVLTRRDRLKMSGIDASAVSAQVIKLHADGHLSDSSLIRSDVCAGLTIATHTDTSVTLRVQVLTPDPAASVRVDLVRQTGRWRRRLSCEVACASAKLRRFCSVCVDIILPTAIAALLRYLFGWPAHLGTVHPASGRRQFFYKRCRKTPDHARCR